MRKVLIYSIIVFLVLSVIPLFALQSPQNHSPDPKESKDNRIDDTLNENIIKSAAGLCQEDFCDEGLKCALAIAANNAGLSDKDYTEKYVEISDELSERLEKAYEASTATIDYEGKKVFIPTSSMSCGFTKKSNEYPYVKSVASPWDCFHEDFVYEKEYAEGVSMAGLNYLCENGMSFKEALKWYLPDFNIK